ncbi:MAG: CpaF family protein [Candidatus Hydrothermarchaeota archaeon]|nr:MAG: CpaF family protein [Candidatus Hydrothermarchaeota archaeon]
MDCDKYSEEISKIHKIVKKKYSNVLVIREEEIAKIRDEIHEKIGEIYKVTLDAVECYVREKLSLGKLTPLFLRDDIEEIMVIGKDLPVYIYDRKTGHQPTDLKLSEEEIEDIITRIANYNKRKIDEFHPLLDARLPDGSRVNATLPVVTPRGATITIRKFMIRPLTIADLINNGTLTPRAAAFLWLAVEGLKTKPANILMIGGTASGKTTTLNVLSYFIPENERIISIEDVQEINLMHDHWIPMETKPPEIGANEITMDELLKNALRMRPDRIIIGEVRGKEALTLFTAMNTGHEGCLATLHANSARESITRLKSHPMNVPTIMLPALDLIVAHRRVTEKGKTVRKIFEIVEISGREGDTILTNVLFSFDVKKNMLEEKILNGRLVQELSQITNLSIKEIDEEIFSREVILELLARKKPSPKEIHKMIQLYYKNPEELVEILERGVQ